jgi:hypothetical protein
MVAVVLGLVLLAMAALSGGAAGHATRHGLRTHHRAHARGLPGTPTCGTLKTPPTYKHIVLIMFENNSFTTIDKNSSAPYINSVMAACGLATNYHNITHPSLPNYIGLSNGDSLATLAPYLPDCTPGPTCQSTENNIFHELGTGWKAYAESMPGNCNKSNSGFYAPRHNPAVYYTDLASTCGTHDVPLGTTSSSPLLRNFAHETTAPKFAMVTPNLCDDMHGAAGCPSNLIKTGDTWLSQWLPLITKTTVYKHNDTLVIIDWDEGEGGSGTSGEACATNTTDISCRVVMSVVGPSVPAGRRVGALLNHYSVLKAIEDLLHVSELGLAKTAPSMLKAFNL